MILLQTSVCMHCIWPFTWCELQHSTEETYSVPVFFYYYFPSEWGKCLHWWFLEHWNRQKSLTHTWQCFSCLLDKWIAKISKKKKIHGGFLRKSTLSVLRCAWTGQINLNVFLGYDINYLSVWPFMRHLWFLTRKASKLTFRTRR